MSAGPATPDPGLVAGYRALRHGCGAHRLARDVLTVHGPDAREFLQGQCSQDVAALAPGRQADALLLAPEGKLVALVRVTCTGGDAFLVDTAGGHGEAVAARLARFRLRSKVEVTALDLRTVALRGPQAASLAAAALGAGSDPVGDAGGAAVAGEHWVLAVHWNGTIGVDVVGPDPAALLPAALEWSGEAAWEALRVEAGIPEMGRELDARTIPAEAGLLARAVSFTKGCYTGQELVARMDARGNRVARRLAGVVVGGDPGDPPVDPADLVGADLLAEAGGTVAGSCTSAAWCPGLGGPAALGYLHRSVAVPGPVLVRPAGAPGRPATARPLPMVGGEPDDGR